MILIGCGGEHGTSVSKSGPPVAVSAPSNSGAFVLYPMIPINPIYDPSLPPSTPKPGKNYSVKIKLVEHGVKISDADLDRQIKMAEKTYSQCDGVNFHVQVVGREDAPETAEEDNLISTDKGVEQLGDVFQSFFSKFPNSPQTGVISINLFDALDAQTRAELLAGQQANSIFEGQAYNAKNMDHFFRDIRSPQYRSTPLSDVGGNSIIIGWKTTLYDESKGTHVNDPTRKTPDGKKVVLQGWRNQSSSLFAHEMGHVLAEKQDGTEPSFKDHFCFGINEYCPEGYLMSGGGFDDRIFLDPKDLKTPIGYSALPKMDSVQCEMLKQSPLVTAE